MVHTSSIKFRGFLAAFSLAIFAVLLPASAMAGTSKPDVLKNLREWRSRINTDDERSTSAQKQIVKSILTMTVQDNLEAPLSEIARVDSERVELEARRRIVDQLIFMIDTKWNGTDLKGFLENQLLDLAITDLSEPGEGGWWKFLIQASLSLKQTAEPGADPIRFLEAYMGESGVLEPKSALSVLKARSYIGN